ncbi:DNA replication and repair protein RecN [Chitinophaga costaii]|uniref:DNA repair protein RecN n=1 Tax=Chitinophaga costaii TaxID=1335309 RepID=A0A1C4C0H2_9BACT|nr:DNA repair protein RecN [Chitinophaga costaii]PUZ27394.1 DNA repair protein RecN [Chitinophaga costaii]SCC12522.1 DNA replication and repair protein RecN [Chitinophaga costaii]
MLQRLTIQNYAIIENLEVDFSGHFNVITGETGAGKSILLGALSLILGERADPGVLFDKQHKCVIEGTFLVKAEQVAEFFIKHELDQEPQLIIRREISAAGKSRAFVNDTPVNLGQLSELSNLLVDLHQQFDTLELSSAHFQREVVDALAGNASRVQAYRGEYTKYSQVQKELSQLITERDHANAILDYNKFLLDELQEAEFTAGEIETLDSELKVLNHSEEIKHTLSRIYFQLREDEQPVVQQLKQLQSSLQGLAAFHAAAPALAERMQSTYLELQDIAEEISQLNDQVNYDAERIALLNERLALGYRLFKKHNVSDTNGLLAVQQQLESSMQGVLNLDERITALEQLRESLHEKLQTAANDITARRQAMAAPFEEKVNALLAQVGMPNARLKVSLAQGALHAYGQDVIELLFDANRSDHFAPVGKVASGGELSRLMLCIKSLVATSVHLPTLIFDEIDTGISGEAARQVGIIMKGLADAHQVICITHQPQIAGKADTHYFVFKNAAAARVTTGVRILSQEERIHSIAQMLSGERPTAAALENAREMVLG